MLNFFFIHCHFLRSLFILPLIFHVKNFLQVSGNSRLSVLCVCTLAGPSDKRDPVKMIWQGY